MPLSTFCCIFIGKYFESMCILFLQSILRTEVIKKVTEAGYSVESSLQASLLHGLFCSLLT